MFTGRHRSSTELGTTSSKTPPAKTLFADLGPARGLFGTR